MHHWMSDALPGPRQTGDGRFGALLGSESDLIKCAMSRTQFPRKCVAASFGMELFELGGKECGTARGRGVEPGAKGIGLIGS